MDSETKRYVDEIMGAREEILEAFIAKYGFEPDEAVQVHRNGPNGSKWYVRRMLPEDHNPRVPVETVLELARVKRRAAVWKRVAKGYRAWSHWSAKSAVAWENLVREYVWNPRGTLPDLSNELKRFKYQVLPAGVAGTLVVAGRPLPWYGRACLWVIERIRGVEVIR
ncbi:MAG: hypothetical protein JSW58_14760 [Candidatus Latescibacterota bacterium]|nr:MAG: hypothetical protein JSW58_14760 [Candidatus Latescibacterota bacterium]